METPTYNGLSIDDLRDICVTLIGSRSKGNRAPIGLGAEVARKYHKTQAAISSIVSCISHPSAATRGALAAIPEAQRAYILGQRDTWFDAPPAAPEPEPEPVAMRLPFLSPDETHVSYALLNESRHQTKLLEQLVAIWTSGVPA